MTTPDTPRPTPDNLDTTDRRKIALVSQYLSWTLAAVCGLVYPDADRVLIEVRPRTGGTTMRTLRPGQPSPDEENNRLRDAIDIVFTVLTGPSSKFDKQKLIEFVRSRKDPTPE